MPNNGLQVTRKGGRKNWLLNVKLVAARLFAHLKPGVKRTHKAAPPHHAVAPDSAEGRSQVNRVLEFWVTF